MPGTVVDVDQPAQPFGWLGPWIYETGTGPLLPFMSSLPLMASPNCRKDRSRGLFASPGAASTELRIS